MKVRVIAIAAALILAAAAALLLARRPPAPAPAPATAPAQGQAGFTPSGIYADDWQARCAPLKGPAQTACTTQLDAAYGKVDAAPVPVPGGGY